MSNETWRDSATAVLGRAAGALAALVLTVSAGTGGFASGAVEAGIPSSDEITRRVNARDDGRMTSQKLVMELTDRRGKTRTRVTRAFRKYFGNEKRTAIFFLEPKNVKGTAFLTFDHPEADRDDDRWLYLPALRKVRRISASDRGGAFLGTDFSYEDIKLEAKLSTEDYLWKNAGTDTIGDDSCLLIEGVPVDEETARELGYGRVVSCIDPEIWMARRTRYWDVAGNPLKTVHLREVRKIQGIWTAHRIEAENHKTGHRTVFIFEEVDYETEVDDDLFTKRALRRGVR